MTGKKRAVKTKYVKGKAVKGRTVVGAVGKTATPVGEYSHMKKVCSTCGYERIWLHGGDCPLCKPCGRCGNRVRHCVCIESE